MSIGGPPLPRGPECLLWSQHLDLSSSVAQCVEVRGSSHANMEIRTVVCSLLGVPPALAKHPIPEDADPVPSPQHLWIAGKRRAWLFLPSGAGSLRRWRENTSSTCPRAPPPAPERSWSSSRWPEVLQCYFPCCAACLWTAAEKWGLETWGQGDSSGGRRGEEHVTSVLSSCSACIWLLCALFLRSRDKELVMTFL